MLFLFQQPALERDVDVNAGKFPPIHCLCREISHKPFVALNPKIFSKPFSGRPAHPVGFADSETLLT
jgi:hypothetical protein